MTARFNERVDRRRRVRVVVYLDPVALGELEAIGAHRDPSPSRSALVGEAVAWMVAKESAWLHRRRLYARRRELRQLEHTELARIQARYDKLRTTPQ